MNKWLIAAGVLAVLLIAAVAFAHGHGARGSDWWGSKAGWKDVGGKGWKDGAGWGRAAGCGANVTLSVATRQVSISGDGIKAALTVDVVGVNVTRFGRVVYGTGSVELGGVSYTAKSVAGFLGGDAARLHHIHGECLNQDYVLQRHVLRRGEAARHGGVPDGSTAQPPSQYRKPRS
jgi:hypothetical protein